MVITDTIRRLREKAGYTQEGMAELLGTTRSNYAYLEGRGEKLTIEQLQRIADALGVSLGEVLGIENSTSEGEKGRVKELEELADLYRGRFEGLRKIVALHVLDILSEIQTRMIDRAIYENYLNENNTKDYLIFDKNPDGTIYDYSYTDVFEDSSGPHWEFFIGNLLTVRQISHLIEELPAFFKASLDFLANAGLIRDEKLEKARLLVHSKKLRDEKEPPQKQKK